MLHKGANFNTIPHHILDIIGRKQGRHVGWDVMSSWKGRLCQPKEQTVGQALQSSPVYNTNHCPHWSHLLSELWVLKDC